MAPEKYETYVPKEFETFSGNHYNLLAKDISNINKEAIFKNWIEPGEINNVKEALLR
jgi:hypothetical protein